MAISGVTRPYSGSLKFGDVETMLVPPHKRDLGMVIQSYALFPHMNVADNVAFPLKLRKVPSAEIERRVDNALDTVEQGGLGERSVNPLSGGQRNRVEMATAIVFETRVPIMDEPLSATATNIAEV